MKGSPTSTPAGRRLTPDIPIRLILVVFVNGGRNGRRAGWLASRASATIESLSHQASATLSHQQEP